jgi:iron(II)-dependent oxidoreductase
VSLGAFELMKTEVTVGQYRKCVDAGVCSKPDTESYCNWERSGREDHPINCVDWDQATTFATWAGGRLPTGEEWTYAATSGGQSRDYPWFVATATCERAIMKDPATAQKRRNGIVLSTDGSGCGQRRTWPVCSKPAGNSTQGVCDLAGNVWEWTVERQGDYWVYRGGSWTRTASYLRASYRNRGESSYRSGTLGFRLAR